MSKGQRIRITEYPGRVQVTANGTEIADSYAALELLEESYPPRFYIPATDVHIERLQASDHVTTCPFKGEASYFHVETAAGVIENAAWAYPDPVSMVAEIAGHIAFDGEKLAVSATKSG